MLDENFGFPASTSGLKATDPFRDGVACRGVEAGDCGVLAPLAERLEAKGTGCGEGGRPSGPEGGLATRPGTDGEERCVRLPADDFRACRDEEAMSTC